MSEIKENSVLTFDEIESCFPDSGSTTDATGGVVVSAQWLHDFAHNIVAAAQLKESVL